MYIIRCGEGAQEAFCSVVSLVYVLSHLSLLEVCWRKERRVFSVCVYLPICIIQLPTFLFFPFFFLHHFLLYLHLLYLLVSVLPVETSRSTHTHTPCLDFTTFVDQPVPLNRQRTLYPDLIPVCDTSGINQPQRGILLLKAITVRQSPDPYMDRKGCDPDLAMNERPTLQSMRNEICRS